MIKGYESLIERIGNCARSTLSVAAAQDRDVLAAVGTAHGIAGIKSILFGDKRKIESLLEELGMEGCEVVDEPDDMKAAMRAVACVREGSAQVLMKGLLNSSDYMRAVLDKEAGLRAGRVLSHLAAFEVPGMERMIFVTDGGVSIAPNLEEKKQILENALRALQTMGYERPNVAVLAANEKVNEKAPATVDAAAIVEAWRAGEFSVPCEVEGPMAFDVALSMEAARHKGIDSRIAGSVDLYLTSTIEVGNVLGKCLAHLAHAEMAGVVLGAAAPIVLTSRSETTRSKFHSIVLACGCAQI